jgi:hypothetical protein
MVSFPTSAEMLVLYYVWTQGGYQVARDPGDYEEGTTLHQQYKNGELSDDAAKILIGDAIEEIDRRREAFEEATELDTTGVFQE